MTLFRPAVIEAQRRRVYGDVTLHQPARLAAFTIVAVISVSIGTAFLALGQFARKETVAGWVAPEAGLSAVYAPRGGVADSVLVRQGDVVAAGQPLLRLALDVSGGDGAVVPLQRAQARARLTELDLQSATFDLGETAEGEYVFFECNPAGQWAWLDTNGTYAEAMADVIVASSKRR
jgi:membrane fusion protein